MQRLVPVIALIAILISFVRLFFGIDFTDESFYVAMPYRFLLGDRPFIDEVNITQTAALLLYPFTKVFYLLTNKLDGLVLYVRLLYFLLFCIVGYTTARILRPLTKEAWTLTLAVVVTFFPFYLPSVSYNTLGVAFLSLSLFLSLSNKKQYAFLTGFFSVLSVWSYPPMVAPILLLAGILFWERRSQFQFALIAASVTAMALLSTLDYDGLLTTLQYSTGAQPVDNSKLKVVVTAIWNLILVNSIWLPILFLAFRYRSRNSTLASLPFLLFPCKFYMPLHWASSSLIIGSIGLLFPFFYLFSPRRPRALLLQVWIPSFFAGFITSYTSANFHVNIGIGLLPGALATLALLTDNIRQINPISRRWVAALPYLTVIGIFLNLQRGVFHEDFLRSANTMVHSGPYAGIHTSAKKAKFIKDLRADIQAHADKNTRVLFFPHFPGGYLISELRPQVASVWGCVAGVGLSDFCTTYYDRNNTNRLLAIHIKIIPNTFEFLEANPYPRDPYLEKFIFSSHKKIVTNLIYDIYVLEKQKPMQSTL